MLIQHKYAALSRVSNAKSSNTFKYKGKDTHKGKEKASPPPTNVFNGTCSYCKKIGHMARDCPNRGRAPERRACIRCGRWECRDPQCSQSYLVDDLKLLTCYVCGAAGHLCCSAGPRQRPRLSCFVCGGSGHVAGDASCPYVAAQHTWHAQPRW